MIRRAFGLVSVSLAVSMASCSGNGHRVEKRSSPEAAPARKIVDSLYLVDRKQEYWGRPKPEDVRQTASKHGIDIPQLVASAIVLLRDPDPGMRWQAARLLGLLEDPAAIPALVQARRDDPDED